MGSYISACGVKTPKKSKLFLALKIKRFYKK